MRWTFVAFLAGCAAPPPRLPAAPDLPANAERHYAIWLGGAQIGTAHETEQWSLAGVVVRRTEAMHFLRGDVPIALATTIEITADRQLVPSRVTWTENAQTTRHGDAVRDPAGWLVTDDAGVRRLPASAIPAELAPLVVRRDHSFAGLVFLPARGFVAGTGRLELVAPHRLIAHLVLDTGPHATTTLQATVEVPVQATVEAPALAAVEATAQAAVEATAQATVEATAQATAQATTQATAEATIDLGEDAMPVRVVDGEGVIATRITAAEAAMAFAPVDLIAATSIPLTDRPAEPLADPDAGSPHQSSNQSPHRPPHQSSHASRRRLALEGDLALPPLPGQASRATPDGAVLELSPRLGGGLPPGSPGADRTREIVTLVARVHDRIAPDLAANPTSAHAAASATTGDCTTFALAYAALAGTRAIPTLVVTGFRVDGDRLVRHRWAVSWTGRAWIAVDAAFGAVPAGGDLVGLAVHDADDLGLIAGEAALTHVRAAAWR